MPGDSCDSVAPWTTWWQDDLPCEFSQERAAQNCSFLSDRLGTAWIQNGLASPGRGNHPILQRWASNGVGAFLELNALAEDLRLIDSVPGIEQVILDLRNSQRCRSAWHVVRSAARFARGGSAMVKQFLPQTDDKIPDFLIDDHGLGIAVEAKILTKSVIEERFSDYANSIIQEIFETILDRDRLYPQICIVLKNPHVLPRFTAVVKTVDRLISNPDAHQHPMRTPAFNVITFAPPNLEFESYRFCMILCPRSQREDLRVQDRAKKASKQLRADAGKDRPGILCLEIGEYQDPPFLVELLARRFARGQYRGISGVLLSRTGTHLTFPRRAPVQHVTVIKNPGALSSTPANLALAFLGLHGHLIHDLASTGGVAAYRVTECLARFRVAGNLELFIPDVRILTPEMLA